MQFPPSKEVKIVSDFFIPKPLFMDEVGMRGNLIQKHNNLTFAIRQSLTSLGAIIRFKIIKA